MSVLTEVVEVTVSKTLCLLRLRGLALKFFGGTRLSSGVSARPRLGFCTATVIHFTAPHLLAYESGDCGEAGLSFIVPASLIKYVRGIGAKQGGDQIVHI